MCPALQKLHSGVALRAGMQRCFWATCTTIGYLRDAWAQYSREDVWGGEFIRSEWKSFTSLSILAIPSQDNGFLLVLRSMYPPHTRSCSTETWTGASQRSLGRALLPSAASSSLFSSLDVNKCLPPTSSHRLVSLLAKFRDMQLAGSPKLPISGLGHLLTHT